MRYGAAQLSEIDKMERNVLCVTTQNKFNSVPAVVTARWSALRAAAMRRNTHRRLRREMGVLREALDDICEPGDCAPQPHTRAQLNRRIDELKVTYDFSVRSAVSSTVLVQKYILFLTVCRMQKPCAALKTSDI